MKTNKGVKKWNDNILIKNMNRGTLNESDYWWEKKL